METRPIFNPSEDKVYRILQRQMAGTRFAVYPGLKLSRPLKEKQFISLPLEERRMMAAGELDFVVVTVADSRPVFAVEFDGPYHQKPQQAKRDAVKNRLCHKAGLPLLRVRHRTLEEHDGVTLLAYMVELFIAWDCEKNELRHSYQQDLRRGIDPWDLTEPETVFAITHPFPATAMVQKRLWEEHRIDWGSDCIQDGRLVVNSERKAKASFVCCVSPGKTRCGDLYKVEHSVTIYPAGRITPVLRFTSKPFSVRGWLPLESDVPGLSEIPSLMEVQTLDDVNEIGEWLMKRVNGMWPLYIPGINPYDVARNFGEYLAFREVEEWANRSLYHCSFTVN